MSQFSANTAIQVNNNPAPTKNPTAAQKANAPKVNNQTSPTPANNNDNAAASFANILEQQIKAETSSDAATTAAKGGEQLIISSEPITATLPATDNTNNTIDPALVVASFLQQFAQQQNANANPIDANSSLDEPAALNLDESTTGQVVDELDHKKPAIDLAGAVTHKSNSELSKANEQQWQQSLQQQAQLETSANNKAQLDTHIETTPLNNTTLVPTTSALTPSTATTNQMPAQATVSTPVSHPQWADDFSQQVSWISTQKLSSAELQLNPANLGPVSISLEIQNDQATLSFSSPHSAVREAIENSLPKLRESLAENGITLGNTTVSDQSPREQAQQQHSAHKTQAHSSGSDSNSDHQPSQSGTTTIKNQQGLLSIFA